MQQLNPNPPTPFHWNQLQQKNDCSIPSRFRHSSIIYKNYLVILGGQQHDWKCPEEILMFDLEQSVWIEADLLEGPLSAKFGFSACIDDQDRIIVYGGVNRHNDNYTDKINILTLSNTKELVFEKKEIQLNTLNFARVHHTANVFQDIMYVFGGHASPQNETNDLYAFDLKDFTVRKCSTNGEPPCIRSQHSSVIHKGKLYIYGGYFTVKGSWGYYETCLDDLWALNIGTMQWERCQISGIAPGPRRGASMEISEDKIFLFGGSDGKANYNNLSSYDIGKSSWELIGTSGNIPHERNLHSASFYRGNMVVFGGQHCDSTVYSITLGDYSEENVSDENLVKQREAKKEVKEGQANLLKEEARKFFIERPYHDVTFSVQNQQVPGHRGLLAIKCPYFNKLFSEQVNKGCGATIDISNIRLEVFNALLEYLYCGEVIFSNEDQSKDLLKAAKEFLLPELQTLCEESLSKDLAMENVIDLSILAEKYGSSEFKKRIVGFIIQNKDAVFQNAESINIPNSILVEVLQNGQDEGPGSA